MGKQRATVGLCWSDYFCIFLLMQTKALLQLSLVIHQTTLTLSPVTPHTRFILVAAAAAVCSLSRCTV